MLNIYENFLSDAALFYMDKLQMNMKTIYIFKLLALATVITTCGCTNHEKKVDDIKVRMNENYHLYMDQQVSFISVSLESVPSSYAGDTNTAAVISSKPLRKIINNKSFRTIPSAIFQYELSSIGSDLISIKQYDKIRQHTLKIVKDSLNQYIRYNNKKVINALVDSIITSYSELFPVKNAYSYYKEQKEYAGTFFQFLESENEDYCNDKNLIPGDCNWGYIFLAANGKSLFKFECVGSDSIQYNIGDYERKADTLVCTFKKSYSYMDKYDPSTGVSIANPNEGKTSKEGSFTLNMLPCECLQYPFIIRYLNEEEAGNSRLQTYVIKIASFKEQDDFIKSIKNITAIAQLMKE